MSEAVKTLHLVEHLIRQRMAALHAAAQGAAEPRARRTGHARADELGQLLVEIRKAREWLDADPAQPAAPCRTPI